jgi:hypothetical protein
MKQNLVKKWLERMDAEWVEAWEGTAEGIIRG